MKDVQAGNIRNIGLVGHGSEGKTTTAEAMLFLTGAIDRMGRVEDGSTVMDSDPEEIRRNITISAAMSPVEYKDHKINVIDIPGYFDFIGEMAGALRVCDTAVILVNAVSGVSVGAEKAWDYAKGYSIARMFFVNQMDRENADFNKTLDALKAKFGSAVVPIVLPIGQAAGFKGVVDVIGQTAQELSGKQMKDVPVPEELKAELQAMRESLMEAAAGADDALMEKYFEEGELNDAEMLQGLRRGIAEGSIVPVLCGSALNTAGVSRLMDTIVGYMPSPLDRGPIACKNARNGEAAERACDPKAPFSALVFKTVTDPFVGKLSFFRVYSGTLAGDTPLYNANTERNEKMGGLYTMRGKKQVTVSQLVAGDIGAMGKLQATATGQTLCDPNAPVIFDPIDFPKPAISLAVTAKVSGEEDKVFAGLYRLAEEDPTFAIEKQTLTSDTLISGQGELHLEVICNRLANKFNVQAQLNDPQVPYRETIRKSVKAEGRHKKQSGGHGQFGHCWVEFEPILDGSAEFEFVDKVVGGVVPRQYIPAVEKGLREALGRGVLAGCPVVNIRCTLYDGSYHAVDSSEMAFKIAARLAFRKGCAEANPVLLEPIYHVEVLIPDEYMGDIIGDLNRRRGRIMGMNPTDGGLQQVVAEVPQSEMFKYATDLRSMTQARGSFTMTFERYEDVPGNISAKIIEQAKKQNEEDEDE